MFKPDSTIIHSIPPSLIRFSRLRDRELDVAVDDVDATITSARERRAKIAVGP